MEPDGATDSASDNASDSGSGIRPEHRERWLVVGGYTAEMDGKARGLAAYVLHGLQPAGDATSIPLTSPSYVVASPDRPLLFALSETSPGTVSSLECAEGELRLLDTVGSGGDGGAHLAVDPSGRWLVVAHYTSGSVASFEIGEDGRLRGPVDVLDFVGSGPDEDRQASAHPHQVVAVGEVLLVPDLGTDGLHLVRLTAEGTLEIAGDPIWLPRGTGPRHLLVTGAHLVVACELSAELWVKSLATDLQEPGDLVPSSRAEPEPGVRVYPSALVEYDGRIVAANRGVDTLAVFELEPATSRLVQVAEVPAGGAWPRDLTVAVGYLWVADQSSDVIAVFEPTGEAPYLRQVAHLPSPSPACVVLV